MKSLRMTLLIIGISLLPITQALADSPCSTRAMAGHWVYASSIGQTVADPSLPAIFISSLGTINIDKNGNISGTFDFNGLGLFFIPDITATGSITVKPDCRGTLYFLSSTGSERTDSIVVVSRNEMLGMSQDPQSVFTYQVRRISGEPFKDDDD